ncbi:bombyxin A-1 homolog [Achroia grisella]|uniref:bombyxin A-1 homolog n=1 Tax=Achroia grisella TaxID=688607 RepID=UPI0027D29221|nr:bombyxin A-1 homolog [Achroia grisella]
MKVYNIFICAFVIIASFASVNSMVTTSARYFCGRKLSEALAMFCPFEDHAKRGFEGLSNDIDMHDWPWLTLPKIRALDGIRGKRQGVASECCLKPCTLPELLSYC